MRLRPELGALLLGLLLGLATPVFPASEAPTQAEIDSAVRKVKSDPDFASEKTVRRLSWDSDRKEKKRSSMDWTRWFSWITDLFTWIGEISQMLMWLIIAALVALLALFLVRMLRAGSGTRMAKRFEAPTHVQDLDIRPESLPDDIGATARGLWDRGEHRAALALLYRGLLSRLAHTYEVPIRDSSTEGDCLMIAARTLESRRLDYATQLVRTWQRAIYGGLSIEDLTVHELCANFDAHLERPVPDGAAARASFADGASA